jgi:ABC-type glycerol-3-phosphate transport system substrate-binding protein
VRFSLGRPILLLILAALASGFAVWRQPEPKRADLEIWSFDENQVKGIRDPIPDQVGRFDPSLLDQFYIQTNFTASASLMGQMGENVRLASAFMSGGRGGAAPDLCEIEIHSIGQFLRPPVDDVGLLPLNGFLEKSGWDKRIVASRFAPWSKTDPRMGKQIIYGIPEDVHPVTITYRKDLFDDAVIELEQATTWDQFQDKCLAFQSYWSAHGASQRKAIGLSTVASDDLVSMLLQQHVNLIDRFGQLHFTDAKVVETVAFYARMVAGARAVGGDVSPGVRWTEDLARGRVCAVFTPDWSADYIRQFTPELAGKVRMMALPRFDSDDAPTSTQGGTMVGICRSTRRPEEAWKLLEFLYLSPGAQRARVAMGNHVLPAIPEYWRDAAYHRADSFFAGNQGVGDLYVTLAREIPERLMTPYMYQAELALAAVEHRAIELAAKNVSDDVLRGACADWLSEAQTDIQRRIDFGKFEP